jgi:hypothetical protein
MSLRNLFRNIRTGDLPVHERRSGYGRGDCLRCWQNSGQRRDANAAHQITATAAAATRGWMRLRCGWDELRLSLTVFSKGGCVLIQRGYAFAGVLLTRSVCRYLSGHSCGRCARAAALLATSCCNIRGPEVVCLKPSNVNYPRMQKR